VSAALQVRRAHIDTHRHRLRCMHTLTETLTHLGDSGKARDREAAAEPFVCRSLWMHVCFCACARREELDLLRMENKELEKKMLIQELSVRDAQNKAMDLQQQLQAYENPFDQQQPQQQGGQGLDKDKARALGGGTLRRSEQSAEAIMASSMSSEKAVKQLKG
jgi:hypothetical protein